MKMRRVADFIKREAVLCIAVLLALVSMFFVPPDAEYAGYIDLRTLGILFCLMTVVAGLKGLGVFSVLAQKLLMRVKTVRGLVIALVLMCFFFSMVITNDVALITFVPFTFELLRLAGEQAEREWLVSAVAMQTAAANLGSMLTPLGNPQNLYLYGRAGMTAGELVALMLPYSALSLAMIMLWIALRRGGGSISVRFEEKKEIAGKKRLAMYIALFVVCLLAVLRVIRWQAAAAAVLVCVLAADRKTLHGVDWGLLATFVGFFVFVGNMGRIPALRQLLESVVAGNEVLTAAASSQIISNVPAALLLSGFTQDMRGLIIGTNTGGLGTLIASMASLISYKQLCAQRPQEKGRYMLCFTVSNVVMLAALLGEYFALRALGLYS